jgi:hypothetical protein
MKTLKNDLQRTELSAESLSENFGEYNPHILQKSSDYPHESENWNIYVVMPAYNESETRYFKSLNILLVIKCNFVYHQFLSNKVMLFIIYE